MNVLNKLSLQQIGQRTLPTACTKSIVFPKKQKTHTDRREFYAPDVNGPCALMGTVCENSHQVLFPALCLHDLFYCENPYRQVLRKQDLRKILLYIIKL